MAVAVAVQFSHPIQFGTFLIKANQQTNKDPGWFLFVCVCVRKRER